jgi:hypothetical protein
MITETTTEPAPVNAISIADITPEMIAAWMVAKQQELMPLSENRPTKYVALMLEVRSHEDRVDVPEAMWRIYDGITNTQEHSTLADAVAAIAPDTAPNRVAEKLASLRAQIAVLEGHPEDDAV